MSDIYIFFSSAYYDKQGEQFFQKITFTTAKYTYPWCYSLLMYVKIHGVNK